jgi:FAD/FMN-containing dehydrogenase
MTEIDIDEKNGTAIVQAGIRDIELYEALGSRGLAFPGGLCPTTGVAELTLGGGQSMLSRSRGLTTRGVYVNTHDLGIKNWPEAYYGRNFRRLVWVKAKYDPCNVFNYPQSIPPADIFC